MRDDDRSYFQHRAEVEIERARTAKEPAAAAAHHQLAQAYLSKIAANNPAVIGPAGLGAA